MEPFNKIYQSFKNPLDVWGKDAIYLRPSPVPAEAGIYGFYFKQIPEKISVKDCIKYKDSTLLYLGVSPARENSKQNLRARIRNHYSGNASGSTLRLSLGCKTWGRTKLTN